jgi:molecular chaperone GrpE
VIAGKKQNGDNVIKVKIKGSTDENEDMMQEVITEKAPEEQPTASPSAELEAAKAQADEYLDQLRRERAQFANYKKRVDRDQSEFTKLANAALITRLLPVVDDFARAVDTAPNDRVDSAWLAGLNLIKRKLEVVLEQEGVEPIPTAGQIFDPQIHQAVTYEAADGFAEGQIIGETEKGYRIGDRVLRPSKVRVAQ